MRELLRDWKRNLGAVALLLACVSTAGWVRSFVTLDMIVFARPTERYFVTSISGKVRFAQVAPIHQDALPFAAQQLLSWHSSDAKSGGLAWCNESRMTWGDFEFLRATDEPVSMFQKLQWTVPYWLINLPLSLLSTCLLLGNPRHAVANSPARATSNPCERNLGAPH